MGAKSTATKASSALSRFERARILGARALQVSLGAPILVKTKSIEPVQIAREELTAGAIKMLVIRSYPDGESERVEVAF